MTGGLQQFARILESIQMVETRTLPVDAMLVRDATQDAWEALMAAKYGHDFETRNFALGPALVTP